jgi:hypothetical protein
MKQVRRWARWLIPMLIVVQLASTLTGFQLPVTLLPVLVGLEVLLAAIVLARLAGAARTARRQRTPGDPWEVTLEATISNLAPGPIGGLVVSEARIFVTFGRWLGMRLFHRPATGYSYHRDLILIGWAMLFALSAPAEMILLHLLIPWAPVRWVLLALEIYGLLWLLAIGVSFGTLRHQIDGRSVRLRLGLLADIHLSRSTITRVTSDVRRTERSLGLEVEDETATLAVNGKTNLVMEVASPVRVRRLFGLSEPVRVIRFHADEPAAFMAALGSAGVVATSEPLETVATAPSQR